jgi:hypothetical protein
MIQDERAEKRKQKRKALGRLYGLKKRVWPSRLVRTWSAGRLGCRLPFAAMSRGLIAGPTCDCVTCLVHKLVASCIAGGFTGRQPVTRARLYSPVIPCSLASLLVLSLAICCSVSHLLGPCFVPGRRGLAITEHRTTLGPPGYPPYPRISEQENGLDDPYSVELIRGSPSAELQAVTMIPWH